MMTWWSRKLKCWVIDDGKFAYTDDDYQRDVWEYIEDMSLGGERYDPFALGQQSSVGRKP